MRNKNVERNKAIRELSAQGWSYSLIATRFGITRQRCQQIVGAKTSRHVHIPKEFVMWDGEKKYLQRR